VCESRKLRVNVENCMILVVGRGGVALQVEVKFKGWMVEVLKSLKLLF